MGFFGGGFSKPGPGVDKDEPQKKRFFLFFDIYFRKFWKLCQLNLMYVLFWIPAMLALSLWIVGGKNLLSIIIVLASTLLLGPATAGATLVLRNFAREEHAFVWSDFKDGAVKNIKQSAVFCFGSTAAWGLLILAAQFYSNLTRESMVAFLPFGLVLAGFIILLFMSFYMYTMIVTFDMPLIQMLKNALIFAVVGLLGNIVSLITVGVIALALFLFFPITVLFIPTFALTTMLFIIVFNAYPKIKQYMIDPYLEKAEPTEEDEAEPLFSDKNLIPGDKDR